MNPRQIFGLQFLLSLVVFALLARWYVSPRLARLSREEAIQPLLVPHVFRHLGMVFLLPTVVGHALPSAFAVPAAYGDLAAGLLALTALAALRARARVALALTWLFSLEGLVDLVNALYQGVTHDVALGAAYYIPIVAVPALLLTHVMIVRILLEGVGARAHLPAPSHL